MATWHPENPNLPSEIATDSADLPVSLFRQRGPNQKPPAFHLQGRPPGPGKHWGQPAQWPDHAAEFWKNCRRSPGDDSALHRHWWDEETMSPPTLRRAGPRPCERPRAGAHVDQDR